MFQLAADRFVECIHIGSADTFAIGGICHDDARRLWSFGPFRQWHHFEIDIFGYASALEVRLGDGYCLGRDVGAYDGHVYLAFAAFVVVKSVEQLAVKVLPMLEGEAFAVDARIDVGCDKRSLDQEGA